MAGKPWPRSSIQPLKSAAVILLGQLRMGCFGGEEEDGGGLDDDVVCGVAGEGVGVGGGGGVEADGVVLGDDDAAGLPGEG